MKLLVFAGAGTSIELGVPAMRGLATEFLRHCDQWGVEPETVKKLMGDDLDIEILIERLDQICAASPALDAVVDLKGPIGSVETLRSEVEWFVQHAAERISAFDAQLVWGPLLRTTSTHDITFVTTNYDRAIELAANAEGVSLDDGFEQFGEREVAPWIRFSTGNERPSIVKLHGSTDWYMDKDSGNPLKLRHPMPLFGRGTLRLDTVELGSSLVLPSREKLLTRAPYPRMNQTFLNAADDCELAIFVGSSLRDHHVREAAVSVARSRPVFVVNPSGSQLGVSHALAISQTASRFLISTLPSALSEADPSQALESWPNQEVSGSPTIVLLRTALDQNEETDRRCAAIEQLDKHSMSLDEATVSKLLQDTNATVSRYALGLVSISHSRTALLKAALASPHVSDSGFASELELLKELLGEDSIGDQETAVKGE